MFKIQMTKTEHLDCSWCLGHLKICILDLFRASKLGTRPQGGESVGPISNFELNRGLNKQWSQCGQNNFDSVSLRVIVLLFDLFVKAAVLATAPSSPGRCIGRFFGPHPQRVYQQEKVA